MIQSCVLNAEFLGLPDFSTADFDVIGTLATENPYLNNQNLNSDFTCEEDSNVAFLFTAFDTEQSFDYVSLTDASNDNTFFSKFLKDIFICYQS